MYAFTTSTAPSTPTDFNSNDYRLIHKWRKHPNLHGWMQRLYRVKGGEDDAFNCATLMLTADDLDVLELTVKAGRLPETHGPFFGISYGDQAELDDDLAFIAKARELLANGDTVFYWSWW